MEGRRRIDAKSTQGALSCLSDENMLSAIECVLQKSERQFWPEMVKPGEDRSDSLEFPGNVGGIDWLCLINAVIADTIDLAGRLEIGNDVRKCKMGVNTVLLF